MTISLLINEIVYRTRAILSAIYNHAALVGGKTAMTYDPFAYLRDII
jgi:hypothetical protein